MSGCDKSNRARHIKHGATQVRGVRRCVLRFRTEGGLRATQHLTLQRMGRSMVSYENCTVVSHGDAARTSHAVRQLECVYHVHAPEEMHPRERNARLRFQCLSVPASACPVPVSACPVLISACQCLSSACQCLSVPVQCLSVPAQCLSVPAQCLSVPVS